MANNYEAKIIEDGEDLILEFPENLIEEMGWKTGDTLKWETKDGNVIVSKVNEDSITE